MCELRRSEDGLDLSEAVVLMDEKRLCVLLLIHAAEAGCAGPVDVVSSRQTLFLGTHG